MSGTPGSRLVDTPVLVGVAVLLLGAVFVWLTLNISVDSVAGDEDVLSVDPLVVQGQLGPPPEFDVDGLGEEYPLVVDLTVEEGLRLAQQHAQDGRILRVMLLGTTPGGTSGVLTHHEEGILFNRMQMRCIWVQGGGSCAGAPAAGLEGELLAPGSGSGFGYTTGGPGELTWEVPVHTSVVVLTVDGESLWQIPIGGVAIFDTDLRGGETLDVAAMDSSGGLLAQEQQVAGR